MNLISREDLKKKIDQKENFKLVDALEADKFRAMHIPGSINISIKDGVENNTIDADINKLLSVDDEIVVYCADEGCGKSVLLYDILVDHGYKNTKRFAGGLRAWEEGGLDFE